MYSTGCFCCYVHLSCGKLKLETMNMTLETPLSGTPHSYWNKNTRIKGFLTCMENWFLTTVHIRHDKRFSVEREFVFAIHQNAAGTWVFFFCSLKITMEMECVDDIPFTTFMRVNSMDWIDADIMMMRWCFNFKPFLQTTFHVEIKPIFVQKFQMLEFYQRNISRMLITRTFTTTHFFHKIFVSWFFKLVPHFLHLDYFYARFFPFYVLDLGVLLLNLTMFCLFVVS